MVDFLKRSLRNTLLGASLAALTAGAAMAQSGEAPAMWRVSDEDSTVYLFGSMHLLPEGGDWRTPLLAEAMAGAPHTIVETDVTSPEAQAELSRLVVQHGMNPAGVTLSQTLGEERAARFAEMAASQGVPMPMLEPLKPWLAMLSVAQQAYAAAGLDPSSGVEMLMLAQAAEEGDEIGYLEPAEVQILALATLDEDAVLDNLDTGIDQLGDLETMIADMHEAWRTGDVVALDETVVAATREDAPAAYQALFPARNAAWTPQIIDFLADDEDYVIIVGAGHLVGDESVIVMLEAEGLDVERVQ